MHRTPPTPLAAVLLTTIATPAAAQFTYQGQLTLDGEPVDGPVMLEVSVFDTPSYGRALAVSTVDITASNGLVRFDPGLPAEEFATDEDRYLEIAIIENGQTTILSPRQLVTPSPLSRFALDANLDLQDIYDKMIAPRSFRLFSVGQDGGLTIDSAGGGAFRFFESPGQSGRPQLVIEGGGERIGLRTEGSSDLRVELPDSSISPAETSAEAGYSFFSVPGPLPVGGTVGTVATFELDAPADGFAIVTATGLASIATASSSPAITQVEFGLEDGTQTPAPGMPQSIAVLPLFVFGTSIIPIPEVKPLSLHTILPVTEGANTFGLFAGVTSGADDADVRFGNLNLSAIFVPTQYGGPDQGRVGRGNERELDRMRDTIEELQRRLDAVEAGR